ncbi:hypothetical protein [Leptolyngbya sp. FACHB-261]|uniref:hypothetical protein n=1 Tax=Leptolyngbya sp. FACHB-261 TaxID=2692806 RepID=UPI001685E25F|nr:hypothetical protein [Leptolyngbya sp. FACHB-261]MBD2103455.1 hypothetical protein [Leptolyngbya sp. FACHB-261]
MTLLSAVELLAAASRDHCVSFCAGAVPLTFLGTAATLALVLFQRPIHWSVALQSLGAALLLVHVWAWFSVGVIMPPTFILLLLASFALLVASFAWLQPQSLSQFLRWLLRPILSRWLVLEP